MARQTAWLAAPVLALGILACGGDGAEQVAPPTARGATDDSPTSAAPSATAESTPTRTPFPTRTPTPVPPTEAPVSVPTLTGPVPEEGMLFAFEEVAIWGPEQGYDFDFPNQLDVGVDGNLYLSEFRGGRVFRISPEGDILAQWGGPATLASMTGIAVDGDGSVYVAVSASNRVRKFNAAGEVVTTWGGPGTGEGLFGSTMGIDISEDGRVYVADFRGARVQVFTTDGEFLFAFGERGRERGQLVSPIGLELEADGNVLVVDRGGQRLQRYSPDGEFLDEYGIDVLGLTDPEIVSVDEQGRIFVADPRNSRVLFLDAEGAILGSVQGESLSFPHGTALIGDTLHLADTLNHVVRVLRLVPVFESEP